MVGSYGMITGAGERFEAEIPAFSLHLPGADLSVN
jgi:ApaG protein